MLTLLRKLRKAKLKDNYLVYAIGEIALVVIGILIALQVNNWSENRKIHHTEQRLVLELINSLEEDIESNQFMITRNEECLRSLETVLEHLENGSPYHDSLAHHFQMAHNRWVGLFSTHAYQNANDFGLDFLPDSTRNGLVYVYEKALNYLLMLEERNVEYQFNIVVPKITLLFNQTQPQGRKFEGMEPLDYTSLREDAQYLNILRSLKSYKEQYNGWHRGAMINSMRYQVHLLKLELDDFEIEN